MSTSRSPSAATLCVHLCCGGHRRQLLACVLELYAEGVACEMAHMLHTSTPGGRAYTRTAIDVIAEAVLMHFQRKQRQAQVTGTRCFVPSVLEQFEFEICLVFTTRRRPGVSLLSRQG